MRDTTRNALFSPLISPCVYLPTHAPTTPCATALLPPYAPSLSPYAICRVLTKASCYQAVGAYVGMCITVDFDGTTTAGNEADQETVTVVSNPGAGVVTVSTALTAGTPTGSVYYITPCGGDRVRLWVDNALVIDQWTSLAAGGCCDAV